MSYRSDVVPPPRPGQVANATGLDARSEVARVFEQMARRPQDPLLAGAIATLGFNVIDAGRWSVRIQDGRLAVSQSSGAADATISVSAGDLMDLAQGAMNPISAYLQGRIGIEGDVAMGLYLRHCFPLRP